MAKVKVKYDGGWAAVPNSLLEDARLSWKAKGLWAYLRSRPSGWTVRKADLIARSTEGDQAVRSAVRELIDAGWLSVERVRGERGKFSGYVWGLLTPHSPEVDFPRVDNPPVDSPQVDNPAPNKKESSKTEDNKTDFGAGKVFEIQFRDFMGIYPERDAPLPYAAAARAYKARLEAGVNHGDLMRAVRNYRAACVKDGNLGSRFVYGPVSFLSTHWEDWVLREPKPDTVRSADGLKFLT